MQSQRHPLHLLVFLLFFLIIGCASQKALLKKGKIDPNKEVAFVKDAHEFFVTNISGDSVKALFKMPSYISYPSWASDGKRVAFIAGEDSLYYLYNYDFITDEIHKLTTLVNNEDNVIPLNFPKWANDSQTLFFCDSRGIFRIQLYKEKEQLFKTKDLTSFNVSEDNNKIIFNDGKTIYLLDLITNSPTNLNEKSSNLDSILNKPISFLSLSPDNQKVLIAAGKKLILLDIKTMLANEIYKDSNYISWVSWKKNSNCLIFLTGKSPTKYAMLLDINRNYNVDIDKNHNVDIGRNHNVGIDNIHKTLWTHKSRGSLKLFSMDLSTQKPVKLFERSEDAESVNPDLSFDGKYVTIISNSLRSIRKVFVVATDGSGWMQVTNKGMCSFPVWRP